MEDVREIREYTGEQSISDENHPVEYPHSKELRSVNLLKGLSVFGKILSLKIQMWRENYEGKYINLHRSSDFHTQVHIQATSKRRLTFFLALVTLLFLALVKAT